MLACIAVSTIDNNFHTTGYSTYLTLLITDTYSVTNKRHIHSGEESIQGEFTLPSKLTSHYSEHICPQIRDLRPPR